MKKESLSELFYFISAFFCRCENTLLFFVLTLRNIKSVMKPMHSCFGELEKNTFVEPD